MMQKKLTYLTNCLLILLAGSTYAQGDIYDPAVNYAVGNSPKKVCISDFDGDTYMDMAVARIGVSPAQIGEVTIFLNNGDGTFAMPVSYVSGNYSWDVCAGDLDGVNHDDLVVANFWTASPSVAVLLNNGDGTFQTAVTYAVADRTQSVACVDFDGDTYDDIVVGLYGGTHVSVFLNNGDGTFPAPVNYTVGDSPREVLGANVDGDADNDLIVANVGTDNVSVLLNNGDGTFQAHVDYYIGYHSYPAALFAEDFNGDTYNDLAVGSSNGGGSVAILLGNGDGTFQAPIGYNVDYYPVTLFAGDLDHDGEIDIASVGGTDSLAVIRGNGDGTFQAYETYVTSTASCGPYGVDGADLDGDTDIDLAVVNSSTQNVSVMLRTGDPMGVDDENSGYLPQEYTLEQNYPNPFNPATEIEYSIPMRSDVVISVFNVLGQHVRSLFEGKRAAGTYQVVWDGKGDDGLPVATGVYLYRLQVDNQIKAKKMLLLK
jgi:hypothetical protein